MKSSKRGLRAVSQTGGAGRGMLGHLLLGAIFLTGLLGQPSAVSAQHKVLASVEELMAHAKHASALISPGGDFVAIGRNTKSATCIDLYDVERETSQELGVCLGLYQVGTLAWVDSKTLLVGGMKNNYTLLTFVVEEVGEEEDGEGGERAKVTKLSLKTSGEIAHPVSKRAGEVLFVPAEDPNSIYSVDPRSLRGPTKRWQAVVSKEEVDPPTLLGRLDETVLQWTPDARGDVRAALTLAEDQQEVRLWFRETLDADWQVARVEKNLDNDGEFIPLGFTADGLNLVVASSVQRDRYGLYEYDPRTDAIGNLIYEHPTAEIMSVRYDYSGTELIAASYIESGESRTAFLGTLGGELAKITEKEFAGQAISISGLSQDRTRATLMASSSGDPGAFWLLDLVTGLKVELARVRPRLDNNRLAVNRTFRVTSKDGTEIESFWTPSLREGATPPLVVMPHGGPIGVSDTKAFSSDIQYLARMGFSVLRVNYRGSGVRGKKFKNAGERQWGRGIEDDIEAAIDFVVQKGWVDKDRICTMGSSYGGYSALMLVIRRPDSYRCAASLMGVTDIALMFNSDDVWGGTRLTEKMAELVGDPDQDYEEQRSYSPVYLADQIKVPVQLAHGDWDRRVDRDQMVRMKLALGLTGARVETIELRKTGHGFRNTTDKIKYFKALRLFLARHLQN